MIIVFGSLNVDMVTHVERLPKSGETVLAGSYQLFAGGKGANQALAASRASGLAAADVFMVGAIGEDAHADFAVHALGQAGVDLTCVARVATPTGVAFITVDANGANQIVVASGANGLAAAAQLEAIKPASGGFLLVQCETSASETHKALLWAKAHALTTVMNLAPFRPLDADDLALIDVLIMNEHEASDLAHLLKIMPHSPETFCQHLSERHGLLAVVTLGAKGAVAHADGQLFTATAHDVTVVDSTAAGDAFCGVFTAALRNGYGVGEALQEGCMAGSLACTVEGAQDSLPHHAAIQKELATHAAKHLVSIKNTSAC